MKKEKKNISNETTPDTAKSNPLSHDEEDSIGFNEVLYKTCTEDVANGTLNINCIQPIESTTSEPNKETLNKSQVNMDTNTIPDTAEATLLTDEIDSNDVDEVQYQSYQEDVANRSLSVINESIESTTSDKAGSNGRSSAVDINCMESAELTTSEFYIKGVGDETLDINCIKPIKSTSDPENETSSKSGVNMDTKTTPHTAILFVKEEQQFYVRKSSSKAVVSYVCYEAQCNRKVYFWNGKYFIPESKPHTHPHQTEMYFNLYALNEIKGVLQNGGNRLRPRQVFDDVMKR